MSRDGKWLLCRLGSVWFGLDLAQVQEIVFEPSLISLPALGRSVAGIMEWLGREISVVDLSEISGDGQPGAERRQVIVLQAGETAIGLLTDEVGDIIPKGLGSTIEIDPLLTASLGSVDDAFEYNNQIIFAINPRQLYLSIV